MECVAEDGDDHRHDAGDDEGGQETQPERQYQQHPGPLGSGLRGGEPAGTQVVGEAGERTGERRTGVGTAGDRRREARSGRQVVHGYPRPRRYQPEPERTGHPVQPYPDRTAERSADLADLLDRLEVDLRSLERVRLAAAAHAAGTRATAGLLVVLPVAGIAVGYGMGADPLRVLLHTPVGAACAAVGVLLQAAGIVWTNRLARASTA